MAENRRLAKAPALNVSSRKGGLTMKDLATRYEQLASRSTSPRMRSFCRVMVHFCDFVTSDNPKSLQSSQWTKFVETLHAFSEQNDEIKAKDEEKLRGWRACARLADYSMVQCKRLREAKGYWSFKKQPWSEVVARLDAEEESKPPLDTLKTELLRAMESIYENDPDQLFWEIRFYARRNGSIHGDAIKLPYVGDFDQLLKVLDHDEANLEFILPKDELKDIESHRRAILRYRQRWFEVKTVSARGNTWIANAEAMKWLLQLEDESKGRAMRKEDPIDLIRKKITTAMKAIQQTHEAVQSIAVDVESLNGKIMAIAEALPADPRLGKILKRILSESGMEEREAKRPRMEDTPEMSSETMMEMLGGYHLEMMD